MGLSMSGDPPSRPPADDPFCLVGAILERKYRVDRVVAHGGYGVVYAGRHLGLDVPVAVKVLKPAVGITPDARFELLGQFLDEAKTIARLKHPHVVGVLDAGVAPLEGFAGGVPWMVLEWLDGKTLRDDLAARRGGSGRKPAECMDLVRPVLEAIAEAHEAGIVHRDLKPSNIMLVPSRRGVGARVLDFGIAKLMLPDGEGGATSGDTATDSRVSSFTAASAAPEQLSGARTGPWTDVFALGLLVTELLTDRTPLPADDKNEHYRAIFDPVRPTPLALGVDVGAWEPVLARALAVRPSDRQANAREMLAELELALAGAISQRIGPSPLETSGESIPESGYAATDRSAKEELARQASGQTAPRARARATRRLQWIVGAALVGAVATGGVLFGGSARRDAVPVAVAPSGSLASTATCVSNKACTVSLHEPAVCRRDLGACVALASEDCTVSSEPRDLDSDETIWIGAMFPKTGPDAAEYGTINHNAVELARRDLAQVMAGLPGERARPLAVLSCDDAVDAKRAASHLVDRVGAAAVIGFRNSVEAIELANSVFVPRGTLALAAINTNPLVTTVPQPHRGPRLVWRTTYSTAEAASAVGRLVEDVLEASVRSDPRVGPHQAIRVASLRPKQAAGAALADALFAKLHYNGKGALENGSDFREIAFDADASEGSVELARATEELLAFKPNVIIFAGGRAIVRSVFEPLETRWPAGAPRPRYVSIAAIYPDVLAFIGRDASRRHRFFGVTPVSDTPANARLVMHYGETFPEKITRTASPNSTYDAFYFLAFASFALGRDGPVTGERLADAFGRLLPPGRPVDVGIAGIFDAYKTLQNGENVDVTGATGTLDFDLARGEAAFDHSILCVSIDHAGRAIDGIPSGLTYVAATRKLDGQLRCP
jgi:serine/threonine protein kinase/ABC-type branched-subunit amino acid transport system substrate-binding protein